MTPYSMDLRERVLAACDDGMTTAEVAEQFSVSPAWVRRLEPRRRETGEVAPRVATPGPAPALASRAGRLRREVRDHPGLAAGEYRDRLGVAVAVVAAGRMLRRLGLTHEKSRSGRPSRTARTSPPSGPRGGPR